jgi:hypothetical protein
MGVSRPAVDQYLNEYTSPRDALRGISRYLAFYNAERPHQSLAYKTPAQLDAASTTSISESSTASALSTATPATTI